MANLKQHYKALGALPKDYAPQVGMGSVSQIGLSLEPMNPKKTSKFLALVGNVVLLLGSLLVVFTLLEVILRSAGVQKGVANFRCYDPIIFAVNCPNMVGEVISYTGAYKTISSTNAAGMFDQEYALDRPTPDTMRIVVLGDSQTVLEYLPREQRFEDLWEQQLTQTLGKRVEVLNYGVGGSGTWDQLQLFHQQAVRFQPNLVVVAFNWGNDVSDNLERWNSKRVNPVWDEYPELTLSTKLYVARKSFNKWLWNHSVAYQFINLRYSKLEASIKYYFRPDYMKKNVASDYSTRVNPEDSTQERYADPPKPDPALLRDMVDTDSIYDDVYFWNSLGWRITRHVLLKLKREVMQAHGRLVVVHFPSRSQIMSPLPLPVEQFRQFLSRNAIPATDLHALFSLMPGTQLGRLHIPGDGHFTIEGVQVLFRHTFPFLLEQVKDIPVDGKN
ncbi:MAG: SGNH/GDSL hydrolase family protein [Magnetococcales bacterium]|nr:SGNH/GDSL hydrolase family protein [Magnetococcales bacterium]